MQTASEQNARDSHTHNKSIVLVHHSSIQNTLDKDSSRLQLNYTQRTRNSVKTCLDTIRE